MYQKILFLTCIYFIPRLEPSDQGGLNWEPFPGSSSNQPGFPPGSSSANSTSQPFPPSSQLPDLPERKSTNSGDNWWGIHFLSDNRTQSRETFLSGRYGDATICPFPSLLAVYAISCIFRQNLFQFPSWKNPAPYFPR